MRAGVVVVVVVAVLASCKGKPLVPCPGEDAALMSDGTFKTSIPQDVADPSGGGVLKGAAENQSPERMVVVVDYSGSMFGGFGKAQVAGCPQCRAGLTKAGVPTRSKQPFYFSTPEFRTYLSGWIDAAIPALKPVKLEVLLFNGKLWRVNDDGVTAVPAALPFDRPAARGDADKIAALLTKVPPDPYSVDKSGPNTTEASLALTQALAALNGQDGLIWLITDNIVDSGGDDDAKRNLSFYELLQRDPRLQVVAAYPLHMAEQCSWMCSTSLFAYGIFASSHERPSSQVIQRLSGAGPDGSGPVDDGVLWNPRLQGIAKGMSGKPHVKDGVDLAGVPLRLKPIDADVITIKFKDQGGQALKCDRTAEFGDRLTCYSRVTIKNTLRHQVVDSALLEFDSKILLPRRADGRGADERKRLAWAQSVCTGSIKTHKWHIMEGASGTGGERIKVGPLKPLESVDVEVLFQLPPVAVSHQSPGQLFDIAFTDRILLDGWLLAEVKDVQTHLFVDTGGLEEVYGAAQLPEIFVGKKQSNLRIEYPAAASLANDGQLLSLLLLMVVGAGGGLFVLVLLRFQRIQVTILVDGAPIKDSKVSMPRLSRRPVEIDGRPWAWVKRGWGDHKIVPANGFRVLRKDGNAVVVGQRSAGEGLEHRIEVKRGWSQRTQGGRGM
ncbi:MAG: hypothetical protein Q8O67_10755 [Deltaproteobacteria bacterium]|nr:hypothetical protein [Deltaproteobacteria bacterium]